MTCDFVDENGERCFGDTEIEQNVYHPNHDEYQGKPESPYPLELCNEHKDKKVDWNMCKKSFDIVIDLEKRGIC